MLKLFDRFFRKDGTSKIAKNRLQAMLFQDRMNLPANFLDMMVCDISSSVSSYLDIDSKKVDIKIGKKAYDGISMPVIEIVLPVRAITEKYNKNTAAINKIAT